jgi:hypothetical protein
MEAKIMMHDMNLLAAVSISACWGTVALAGLAGAIYYESQARQRVPQLVPGLRLISGHAHASRQTPARASR